jgi:hypothetical protein
MERTWKPTTAGVLTIIAGGLGICAGSLIVLLAIPLGLGGALAEAFSGLDIVGGLLYGSSGLIGMIGAGMIGLGAVAVAGGIYALKRRLWNFALAGAILAAICSIPLGVLAIIFVSIGKKEFDQAGK